MKITILPFEKREQQLDPITMYNIIKRCQEDLLYGYPDLQEFILEIKMHPTFIKYNSMPRFVYSLCEDESTMKLMIASYPLQLPERVYEFISEKLMRIKIFEM